MLVSEWGPVTAAAVASTLGRRADARSHDPASPGWPRPTAAREVDAAAAERRAAPPQAAGGAGRCFTGAAAAEVAPTPGTEPADCGAIVWPAPASGIILVCKWIRVKSGNGNALKADGDLWANSRTVRGKYLFSPRACAINGHANWIIVIHNRKRTRLANYLPEFEALRRARKSPRRHKFGLLNALTV